jgi:hypothetical protein
VKTTQPNVGSHFSGVLSLNKNTDPDHRPKTIIIKTTGGIFVSNILFVTYGCTNITMRGELFLIPSRKYSIGRKKGEAETFGILVRNVQCMLHKEKTDASP